MRPGYPTPAPAVSHACGTWKPCSGPCCLLVVRQADRERGGIPGQDRMPKKQMPAAERRQENGAAWPAPLPAVSYNWPDTGPGARARKRADVGR